MSYPAGPHLEVILVDSTLDDDNPSCPIFQPFLREALSDDYRASRRRLSALGLDSGPIVD